MTRRILVLVALICLLACMVNAQVQHRPRPSREGRWDFSLQTRYTGSKSSDRDGGSSLELNDDLGWGFGFAYNLSQHFNLGLVFTWRSVNYNATAVDYDDESNVTNYSGTMSTSTFGFTGDWNILDGPITPYVSGAFGWMLIDTNIFAGYGGGCWYDPWWGYVCGNYPTTYGKNTVVGSLGVGCRFQVGETVFFKVGYDRGWSDLDASSGTDILRIDFGLMN